ncbi:calcium-binding protein [Streptomyces sp. NPDC048636]|uniref:calcium-binding protein n=1 Tax=Streptomyces sp. NPDC048636 TaxID=3155762 RepID=UPI003420DEB4
MRKRMAFVVLATAAAGIGALVAPAAQADGSGDTALGEVTVSGGDLVVGTTKAKTFQVAVTASDDSGIKSAEIYLDGPSYGYLSPTGPVKCVASATDAHTSTCTASFTVDPRVDFIDNAPAGTWYANVWVDANDDDYVTTEKAASFTVRRASKLTVNAAPEPVRKGRTITVTGALTRANWETAAYAGYTVQPVTLEFRKKSGTGYTAVKTVKSGGGGALKTTVTAAEDGYFRWNFAGNGTTPPVKSTADFVDVQ